MTFLPRVRFVFQLLLSALHIIEEYLPESIDVLAVVWIITHAALLFMELAIFSYVLFLLQASARAAQQQHNSTTLGSPNSCGTTSLTAAAQLVLFRKSLWMGLSSSGFLVLIEVLLHYLAELPLLTRQSLIECSVDIAASAFRLSDSAHLLGACFWLAESLLLFTLYIVLFAKLRPYQALMHLHMACACCCSVDTHDAAEKDGVAYHAVPGNTNTATSSQLLQPVSATPQSAPYSPSLSPLQPQNSGLICFLPTSDCVSRLFFYVSKQ